MSQEPVRTAVAAGSRTVWGLVFDPASSAPGAVAVMAPGRDALTFGELTRHFTALSAALNAKGIGRNDRVALACPTVQRWRRHFSPLHAAPLLLRSIQNRRGKNSNPS